MRRHLRQVRLREARESHPHALVADTEIARRKLAVRMIQCLTAKHGFSCSAVEADHVPLCWRQPPQGPGQPLDLQPGLHSLLNAVAA